jgi:hypothetical protein
MRKVCHHENRHVAPQRRHRQQFGPRDDHAEPAAKRQGEQQQRIRERMQHCVVLLRHRVVGSLGMGGEADPRDERDGHLFAVTAHVGDLAPRKPEPHDERSGEGEHENEGKSGGSHDGGMGGHATMGHQFYAKRPCLKTRCASSGSTWK